MMKAYFLEVFMHSGTKRRTQLNQLEWFVVQQLCRRKRNGVCGWILWKMGKCMDRMMATLWWWWWSGRSEEIIYTYFFFSRFFYSGSRCESLADWLTWFVLLLFCSEREKEEEAEIEYKFKPNPNFGQCGKSLTKKKKDKNAKSKRWCSTEYAKYRGEKWYDDHDDSIVCLLAGGVIHAINNMCTITLCINVYLNFSFRFFTI